MLINQSKKGVIIIGGGLAGLLASIRLVRKNIRTVVLEKKEYPFHRVCGEYISNETLPYLHALDAFPKAFGPSSISKLQLTSVNGREARIDLDLGGFGISRYSFDEFLYNKARAEGVQFYTNTEAEQITHHEGWVTVKAGSNDFEAEVVMGTFGKRSKLDYELQRDFIQKKSPYVGVKYHVRIDRPQALISLHNFENGYCGISNIEDGKSNLCYLTHRDNIRRHGSIPAMEEKVMFRNPFIKSIYEKADFLFEKPEVINEISFATKSPVVDHILMVGDAAGMITPLCGNGMAMGIHASKVACQWIEDFMSDRISRKEMEEGYSREWNQLFASRLWAGRQFQRLFGGVHASNFAVVLARNSRRLTQYLVSQTHGKPF